MGVPSRPPADFESVSTPDSNPLPRLPSVATGRPASAPSNPAASGDPPLSGVPTSIRSLDPAPPVSQPSIHSDGTLQPALLEPTISNVCESRDGNFGSFDGESSILSYGYEVETTAVTQDELLYTILPALEVAITNVLLPVFFDGCYRRRHLTSAQIDEITDRRRPRRLQMVGVSSLPVDVPLQEMKCKSFARGNSCSVVRGDLTLHFSDLEELESETKLIRKVLRQVLDGGALDEGVHESIVRVRYVDVSALLDNGDGDNSPNASATTSSQPSERLGSSFVVGLVLAAAASVFIVGMVFAHRRRQHRLRRRSSRGEPVSSGPPSPARESDGPALDPLVDQTTTFPEQMGSTADVAQPVSGGSTNDSNTDDEGRSEGSVYLEGPESGQQIDRQLSLAMSPIQFVEGLCVGTSVACSDGAKDDEIPIPTILVPDRFGADRQVRKTADLSSPTDESVYLDSPSFKDESQSDMRFT
jgi:hypothetical protein